MKDPIFKNAYDAAFACGAISTATVAAGILFVKSAVANIPAGQWSIGEATVYGVTVVAIFGYLVWRVWRQSAPVLAASTAHSDS